MRRSVAALALIALFASVPSFGAETTAVAPTEPSMAAPADAVSTPAPAATVLTPNSGEVFHWLKAETPVLPELWLAPAGCGAYCRTYCEGCCAIGPTWCACC